MNRCRIYLDDSDKITLVSMQPINEDKNVQLFDNLSLSVNDPKFHGILSN